MYNNALKNKTKLCKAGNSWNFRVTRKDRKALDADQNTIFENIIDPNGQKIMFKKMEAVDPSLDSFMDRFYLEHG
ncbi:AbrB family transcriptional regulator, partial [Lactobacillus jensenii]|uniref:AbrB family transcriptional regulator n=1 Tax=Lactobacillus jensenii TaxID=109790 RepID=UPI0028703E16